MQQAKGIGNLSEGDGTDINPYKIQSIEDLVTFSKNVNDGQSYEGKNFSLLLNLDFKNEKSYIDANRKDFGDINGNGIEEELIKELTTGKGFTPIGSYSKPAKGIRINGNNNILVNFYQNTSDWAIGLLGVASDIEVVNLKFRDANITAGGAIGCIIGEYSGNIKIHNVHVGGIITSASWGGEVGGLVGRGNNSESIEIKDSSNKITINCKSRTGGLIGNHTGGKIDVLNSFNTSNIDVTGVSGAGIIGYISSAQEVIIKECYNKGNINALSGAVGGGIVARVYGNNIIIENCYNIGSIQGTFNSRGGIIGQLEAIQKATIKECYNKGEIQGETDIGGIIGVLRGDEITIEKCYNNAKIISLSTSNNAVIGGIIGNCSYGNNKSKVKIMDSYNDGEVYDKNTKCRSLGGIAGSLRGDVVIQNCYNKGKIKGYQYTAGIIGMPQGNSIQIKECYNEGDIENTEANIGGIIAQSSYVSNKVEITNCYNTGKVEHNNAQYSVNLGGISGSNYKVYIYNSYNIGNIKGTYGSDHASGIGGFYVENCYNTGIVIGGFYENYIYASGITEVNNDGVIKKCYNIGKTESISENNSLGYGIGYCYGGNKTLDNNYYLKGVSECRIV